MRGQSDSIATIRCTGVSTSRPGAAIDTRATGAPRTTARAISATARAAPPASHSRPRSRTESARRGSLRRAPSPGGERGDGKREQSGFLAQHRRRGEHGDAERDTPLSADAAPCTIVGRATQEPRQRDRTAHDEQLGGVGDARHHLDVQWVRREPECADGGRERADAATEHPPHGDGDDRVERERVDVERPRRAASHVPQRGEDRHVQRAVESRDVGARRRPVGRAPHARERLPSAQQRVVPDDRRVVVDERRAQRRQQREHGGERHERADERGRRAARGSGVTIGEECSGRSRAASSRCVVSGDDAESEVKRPGRHCSRRHHSPQPLIRLSASSAAAPGNARRGSGSARAPRANGRRPTASRGSARGAGSSPPRRGTAR